MKRTIFTLTLLALLLIPAGSALAAPAYDIVIGEGESRSDVELYGDSLEVKSGGTVSGDVTIFGGDADIAGTVEGNLAVFGGNVALSGTVEGDLVSLGGNLTISESADIDGDCVVLGGNVEDNSTRSSCARFDAAFPLSGFLGEFQPPPPPTPPTPPDPPVITPPSMASRIGGFFINMLEVLGRSLIFAFVAFAIGALAPTQLERVSSVIRSKPIASGAVGLLTAIAAPSLITLLLIVSAVLTLVCIGLLGFPVVIVLSIALLAAIVFGWVAVGNLLGHVLVTPLQLKQRSTAVTATLGTFVLTAILSLLALPRFIPGEGLVAFVLVCIGLGATALTQFGTKPYPPANAPAGRSKADGIIIDAPITD